MEFTGVGNLKHLNYFTWMFTMSFSSSIFKTTKFGLERSSMEFGVERGNMEPCRPGEFFGIFQCFSFDFMFEIQ